MRDKLGSFHQSPGEAKMLLDVFEGRYNDMPPH
jgi:hypothetical protein